MPPNTTATVILPGGDGEPIEVGSGTHRWTYPYQVPPPVRVPLTSDSTLGEVIDDPEAWAAVLAAIRRHMPDYNGGEFSPKGAVGMPLRRVFWHHPNRSALLPAIDEALAGLADQ
jgi:alpha-L-rhamnosidase